jgi:hypothetical protein
MDVFWFVEPEFCRFVFVNIDFSILYVMCMTFAEDRHF